MIESDFGTMCIQDVTLSFAHVGHNWTDLWCLELLFVCFFLQFTLMFNVLPSFCCSLQIVHRIVHRIVEIHCSCRSLVIILSNP